MLKATTLLPLGALALALSISLAAPPQAAAQEKEPAKKGEAAKPAEPFIDLSADGKREARFDSACGSVNVEVLDPDSTSPRFILSGTCNGTVFDVVATATKLPGKPRVTRVRFMDVATGQERVASSADIDVQVFGQVGGTVSGRLDFTMPETLKRPARHVVGTFQVARSKDRFSP